MRDRGWFYRAHIIAQAAGPQKNHPEGWFEKPCGTNLDAWGKPLEPRLFDPNVEVKFV
jgi:hypothetical protein